MDITVVLPSADDDEVSNGLRRITKAICDTFPNEFDSGYGLGGEHGYGENFENEVFMMHKFCWCSGDDCPWCSYSDDEGQYFQERFRCYGAEDGGQYKGAPNFWHKHSGFKVWWYKWIGRDNEFSGVCDWRAIEAECLSSIVEMRGVK